MPSAERTPPAHRAGTSGDAEVLFPPANNRAGGTDHRHPPLRKQAWSRGGRPEGPAAGQEGPRTQTQKPRQIRAQLQDSRLRGPGSQDHQGGCATWW